ncbi:MAG TPA: DUF433 domain-containing protein [Thermoanaerobaculia bacterium]|nr:DUF433 domain-containing protein [Thermoanaerobaculia bacterium]
MNPRIEINPQIQGGRPVFKGTRIPVAVILAHLAGGESRDAIIREYRVTEEDIAAALEWAVELVEAQTQRPARAS